MTTCRRLVPAVALVVAASHATAQITTYTYTGRPLTDLNCVFGPCPDLSSLGTHISGWVEYASPLPANSGGQYNDVVDFDFTTGVLRFTRATAYGFGFSFKVDGLGNIAAWLVQVQVNPPGGFSPYEFTAESEFGYPQPLDQVELFHCKTVPACLFFPPSWTNVQLAGNLNSPGTWVRRAGAGPVVATPEPQSWLLLATGFGGTVGFSRLRRRRRA